MVQRSPSKLCMDHIPHPVCLKHSARVAKGVIPSFMLGFNYMAALIGKVLLIQCYCLQALIKLCVNTLWKCLRERGWRGEEKEESLVVVHFILIASCTWFNDLKRPQAISLVSPNMKNGRLDFKDDDQRVSLGLNQPRESIGWIIYPLSPKVLRLDQYLREHNLWIGIWNLRASVN